MKVRCSSMGIPQTEAILKENFIEKDLLCVID
jgi:hypothetical protein